MIAAALAGRHLKVTAHEGRGGTCAAEMDEGGEILLLLRACRCVWRAGKNRRDIVVQVHGRELDGMARDRAGIEAGEPAVGIYDSVPSDTVACRLGVSCIGHLVHAHSARGGLVHSEGIPGELPAPVGARHRIAGAFDLRQCGQQLGRDRAGGIRVEERFVLPPRFDRFLVELPADEKEQLARLADNVIDEVCQRECREDERREANDPNRPRCCAQRPSHQARASPAADAAEQAVPALPDARLARAGLGSARRGHADVWPVVRRHATAGRRGVIRSGVRVVQRRTMSHTDMGIVGATTDSFILFENGVRRNRLVLPGLSNAADHTSAFAR